MSKSYLKTKDKRIEFTENLLKNLDEKKEKLNTKLEKELGKISENSKCGGLRLVKTYNSFENLKHDNHRKIKIEDDKLMEGEIDNFVKPGQYAILFEDGNKKILKE